MDPGDYAPPPQQQQGSSVDDTALQLLSICIVLALPIIFMLLVVAVVIHCLRSCKQRRQPVVIQQVVDVEAARLFRTSDGRCKVCMAELADGEAVRVLPLCAHYFPTSTPTSGCASPAHSAALRSPPPSAPPEPRN